MPSDRENRRRSLSDNWITEEDQQDNYFVHTQEEPAHPNGNHETTRSIPGGVSGNNARLSNVSMGLHHRMSRNFLPGRNSEETSRHQRNRSSTSAAAARSSPSSRNGRSRRATSHARAKDSRMGSSVYSIPTPYILVAIVVIYSILAFRIYTRLQGASSSDGAYATGDGTDEIRGTTARLLHQRLLQRHFLDQQESLRRREIQQNVQKQYQSRRELIRPQNSLPELLYPPIHPQTNRSTVPPEDIQQANLAQLCGFHAQNASLTYPDAYLHRDALQENSRVVIIGILHPIAIHLALLIEHRCKAKVVFGSDLMLPNTPQRKLDLLPYITRLSRILDLDRPIINSYYLIDSLSRHNVHHTLPETDEMDIMHFDPTHILYLGHPDQQSSIQYNTQIGTLEQILFSIAHNRGTRGMPHLSFVATPKAALSMEVIASTYQESYGIHSNMIEISTEMYGPLCNSTVDTEIKSAIAGKNGTNNSTDFVTPVYVHDVVEGVIAAMQFRHPSGRRPLFSFTGSDSFTKQDVSQFIESSLQKIETANRTNLSPEFHERKAGHDNQFIDWSPYTSIADGLTRSIAWHFDDKHPHGVFPGANTSIPIKSGSDILDTFNISKCHADDVACRLGRPLFPCASECSVSGECTPSIFDGMHNLMHELTEGCEVVLLTQELSVDAERIDLQSEFTEDGSPTVCNFAFVNKRSKLVEESVKKVPPDKLVELGAVPRLEDDGNLMSIQERALPKLNGRLLFRGWILVWPETDFSEVTFADKYLLKLSPSKLFHTDVKYSIFVEDNIGVELSTDDVRFLADEMHRHPLDTRVAKQRTEPAFKVRLPPEPGRKAVLFVSELRYQDSHDPPQLPSTAKISLRKAVNYMKYEVGEIPEERKIKSQMAFYERLGLLMNKKVSQRRASDPIYQFRMKHWARTRWVVHDLRSELGRHLRCDWYEEHLIWRSSLDQLSLAKVLATRELDLRVSNSALDEGEILKHQEALDAMRIGSDSHEWLPLLYNSEVDESILLAKVYDENLETSCILRNVEMDPFKSVELPYVRIISERNLGGSRKAWARQKAVEQTKDPSG